MRYRSCALSPTPVSVTVATAWLPAASAVTVTVPPEGVARPAILVAGLLGPDAAPYTQGRCCYDLCRLKLKGLIVKIEHTDTYVLIPGGQRFAVFCTKVHNRLLRPLLAAVRPGSAPRPASPAHPRPGCHRRHVRRAHDCLKLGSNVNPSSDPWSLATLGR